MVKLPKTIFVFREGMAGEEYLVAGEKLSEVAPPIGETRRVGIYELLREQKVESKVIEVPFTPGIH